MNWFAFGQALADGHAQRKDIDQQREIGKFNRKNAEQNAALKGQQTSAAEEQIRRQARQVLGAERAGIAQSGVGFGGSSLAVLRRSTANAELDALNIRYAGDLERNSILNEIEMLDYSDRMLRLKGKQVMRMRWGTAMAGLFGGGGMSGQGGNAQSYGASATSKSGMSYSAPATKDGSSWMNGYGASSYAKAGYSSPKKKGGT